jgi:2-polyprenyl-6-methoxyphenol hydroxylase-like FAD-dependent oxidoreductase
MTRIVVIGAGVGGLACGALLAKSGYKVEVCEKKTSNCTVQPPFIYRETLTVRLL